jgi:beta-phosphoglucomutase-like phosphatase (HAD superfamily)
MWNTYCQTTCVQALPKLSEVQAAMTQYFVSQSSRAGLGLELLPGVQQLLETLKVRPTLLTSSSRTNWD